MNIEDGECDNCACTLLSISDNGCVSAWDDYSHYSSPRDFGTKGSTRSKSNRQMTVSKLNSRLGYDSPKQSYMFQHHERYTDYIKDYNEVFLKPVSQRRNTQQQVSLCYSRAFMQLGVNV